MNWIEVTKNELWKHPKTDTLIRREGNEYYLYDSSDFNVRIPIKDFLDSPAIQIIKQLNTLESQSVLYLEVISKNFLTDNQLATIDGDIADNTKIYSNGQAIGFVTIGRGVGEILKLQLSGVIENPSWSWIPGQDLFLSANTLSSTPTIVNSKFIQKVARAVTPTKILITIEKPVLLN